MAHQLQSVDIRIVVDVFEDVPVGKPRVDDAKREHSLRNSEELY